MKSYHTTAPVLPAWRFVPAADAVALARWDAEFSVHASAIAPTWRTIAELGGMVTEGLRPGRTAGPEPVLYRHSNLDRGLLSPGPEQLSTPPSRSARAVGPGDVVVSKFLPPRAAVVSPDAPRHTPDANCLRVLGLTGPQALWFVALLDHPSFAALVARQGSGTTLPRVGARDLAELSIPPAPEGLAARAAAWSQASDERIALHRDLLDLRAGAQALADDTGPPPPDPSRPTRVSAVEMPDTWAPDQAALVRYQRGLARAGWVPLRRFLAREPARLRGPIPPARVLHLNEATGDLGFRLPPLEPVRPPWFRIYADPLRPGEVLLSTLGSAPKVVLNAPPSASTVWVSDPWARLDGGDTAGALALLLETSQVTWQLGSAATGAVRQFIGRSDLAEIRVPAPNATVAATLHSRVVAFLERRHGVEGRLDALRSELADLVTKALEATA